MGLFSFLGEKKPERTAMPSYQKSPYDKESAATIYDYYATRAKGENTGFSETQLTGMRGEAIDQAAQSQKEFQRISASSPYSRRGTGGVYAGSAQKMQERAVSEGLTLRSNALRDISLRNEILKKTEQESAVAGLNAFLSSERQEAARMYGYQLEQFKYDDAINQAISAWKSRQKTGWIDAGETMGKATLNPDRYSAIGYNSQVQ